MCLKLSMRNHCLFNDLNETSIETNAPYLIFFVAMNTWICQNKWSTLKLDFPLYDLLWSPKELECLIFSSSDSYFSLCACMVHVWCMWMWISLWNVCVRFFYVEYDVFWILFCFLLWIYTKWHPNVMVFFDGGKN